MKQPNKKSCFSRMTASEKLLWAATYAVEYNRWTCGDERSPETENTLYDVKSARVALSQATMSVLAARTALKEMSSTALDVVPLFARQMVLVTKAKKKRRHPNHPKATSPNKKASSC